MVTWEVATCVELEQIDYQEVWLGMRIQYSAQSELLFMTSFH